MLGSFAKLIYGPFSGCSREVIWRDSIHEIFFSFMPDVCLERNSFIDMTLGNMLLSVGIKSKYGYLYVDPKV